MRKKIESILKSLHDFFRPPIAVGMRRLGMTGAHATKKSAGEKLADFWGTGKSSKVGAVVVTVLLAAVLRADPGVPVTPEARIFSTPVVMQPPQTITGSTRYRGDDGLTDHIGSRYHRKTRVPWWTVRNTP